MTARFTAPKGVPDYLPPRSEAFLAVRDALVAPLRRAGYRYVETAVFEDTTLFERGVGESTDVVSKEMYTFADKGGRSLTLRPEATAGIVRAVVEHGADRGQLPLKVWYAGPYFRYERPQAGRFRQFQQVDAEAIGTDDPAVDAELIALAVEGYAGAGLSGVSLQLNSLGDAACRPGYRDALLEFLAGLDLDAETRARATVNPLRVLDDKRSEVAAQLVDAPVIADHLCAACRGHYDAVRSYLRDLGVAWTEAPRLVRGLDYYTRTTFEFVHDGLGAQSSVGGGGRYDGLSEAIGGPALPAIGFGLGVDRTLLALESESPTAPTPPACDVFIVPLGDAAKRRALILATELRRSGISTDLAFGDRGMKGAMKAADRTGARYALVVGDRDLESGTVAVKEMSSGEQQQVALADVVAHLGGRTGAHP